MGTPPHAARHDDGVTMNHSYRRTTYTHYRRTANSRVVEIRRGVAVKGVPLHRNGSRDFVDRHSVNLIVRPSTVLKRSRSLIFDHHQRSRKIILNYRKHIKIKESAVKIYGYFVALNDKS